MGAAPALLACALLAMGCGGGAGGGTNPPPPATITLTSTGPYNETFEGSNWVVAGVPEFTLLATGTGFTTTCIIRWNGTALPTQYGTSTGLAATVSSALAAAPGTVSITVYDPSSGATSNSLPLGIASPAAATAGVVMITVAPDGTPANDDSLVAPSISTTGRFIAFQSAATNLAPGPASGYQEIYERDTCIGAPAGCTPSTTRITVTDDGTATNGHSYNSVISADGRYVAFDSKATNLVPGTAACIVPVGSQCVYLRDTCTGVAARVHPNHDSPSAWRTGPDRSRREISVAWGWGHPTSECSLRRTRALGHMQRSAIGLHGIYASDRNPDHSIKWRRSG